MFLNIILILFLKKDVLLHNLNKMNLLTSMLHSPTYQQVVLGKLNQRKQKGKEIKLKTIKYEKGKEINETFKKKSDYRIENTHGSLGQPTETGRTSRFQKNTMAHDIPKLLLWAMKTLQK